MPVRMEPMPDQFKYPVEWKMMRQGTVGGSDANTIAGLNPYQSQFSLAATMEGRVAAFEGNLATETGHHLEPFCAKRFEDVTKLRTSRTNYIYFNDEYPNQHALPDRFVFYRSGADSKLKGYKMGLEIKTTSSYGKLKGGTFPEQYYAQCVQYLSLLEYDIWFLYVLVGNREEHIFMMRTSEDIPVPEWVESDIVVGKDEFVALREMCNEFMDMVHRDELPSPDGSESSTESVKDLCSKSEPDSKTWFEDDDFGKLLDKYITISADYRAMKKEHDAIQNVIKMRMGEYESAGCGAYEITYKTSYQNRIDSTRLKNEEPELYRKYLKQSASRTLHVK